MFKSKLQWEVTMVCDVAVSASFEHHCPNVSEWPSSSQRQCQCFFTKRVEGGLQEKQCCGSALVVMQCGYGSSILGQCGCVNGSRDLMTKNFTIKKIKIFIIKNCIPRDLWRASKLQEKPPALKGEHPALQKQYISSLFPPFCGHFAYLDPDPDPIKINADSDPHNEERSSLFISHFAGWLIFDCCIYATYTVKKGQWHPGWGRENRKPF